jgi:hypothetical protein
MLPPWILDSVIYYPRNRESAQFRLEVIDSKRISKSLVTSVPGLQCRPSLRAASLPRLV